MLPPCAVSNTALAWSVLVGALGVLAFVPAQGALSREWGSWLLVALGAEAAFAIVLVALRASGGALRPVRVALVLLAAGAARGLAIAAVAGTAGLAPFAANDAIGRVLNSAVFCLFGGALIGATLAWRRDFREQYRVLVDRALMLDRAHHVDRDVLASWTSIKTELDETLRTAQAMLAGTASAASLTEAASLLTSAVDLQVRPTSRAIWDGALPERPPISMYRLLRAALGSWQLPLVTILAFFAVLVGIGSIVRVGVVPGMLFTVEYLVLTGTVLGLSILAVRIWPSRTLAIAIGTLAALPVLLLTGSALIADRYLGLQPDRVSEIVIAVQAPVTTVLIAMAVEAVRQRRQVLDSLQARIDADAMRLLAGPGGSHGDAQRLSVFMHHSVQSELIASAMQLREAALTGEPSTMSSVSASVLMRLAAVQDLDAAAPPWLGQPMGYERIEEIVAAWQGILDVRVSLPRAPECTPHQWLVATQVIEEGLANAARHGDASRVAIAGRVDDAFLTLSIEDDGSGRPDSGAPDAGGMGMQWLDRIAPGDWALHTTTAGSRLVVTIR